MQNSVIFSPKDHILSVIIIIIIRLFGCVTFDLPRAHHVVPKALGQLLVALDGEVEAVVSEEGHIDLPVLLRDTKHLPLIWVRSPVTSVTSVVG